MWSSSTKGFLSHAGLHKVFSIPAAQPLQDGGMLDPCATQCSVKKDKERVKSERYGPSFEEEPQSVNTL